MRGEAKGSEINDCVDDLKETRKRRRLQEI